MKRGGDTLSGHGRAWCECRPFSEIYDDGKEMCEKLWDNSFSYETQEANAYTWHFGAEEPNPNNHIAPSKAYPTNCPGFDADSADCNGMVEDMEDRVNFVQSSVVSFLWECFADGMLD